MKGKLLSKRRIGWNIALIIAGLILGFFFAAQWNISPDLSFSTPLRTREDLAATIIRLESEQAELKKTIDQLRHDLTQEQERMSNNTKLLEGLTEDLESQRVAAGLVALKGPGVRVILADSDREKVSPGSDLNLYLIHEYDIRDILNFLWASEIEAVAINDERVVGTTSIYCVGSTIMVNDTRLSPPYVITAIGDANKLDKALNNPAYFKDLRARAKTYGVQFRVAKEKEVQVPAYRGSFVVKYARPGGS
jgi:uncharacterized protein YlxW (UPF0749 family)